MATIERRKDSKGQLRFRVKVRIRGGESLSATFDRISHARRWANETESRARELRNFGHVAGRKQTFADAIDRYFKDVLPYEPKKRATEKTRHLLWWKSNLGRLMLNSITPDVINDCRVGLRGSCSASTINRYTASLSRLFTVVVIDWCWLESNPVTRLQRYKEPRGRMRYLTDPERIALLEACKAQKALYVIVVLSLSTGARSGEILNLRWSNVDLLRQRIVFEETKNGERRAAHLGSLAYETLMEWSKVRRLDSDLVFPQPTDPSKPRSIRTSWLTALRRAKIEDFRFHDLRHTCASYLAMNGATGPEIAEVLGHRTLSMVKRYAHLSDTHVAAVVEKMNEKVFG